LVMSVNEEKLYGTSPSSGTHKWLHRWYRLCAIEVEIAQIALLRHCRKLPANPLATTGFDGCNGYNGSPTTKHCHVSMSF
jgi:hypothetical protein